VIRDPDAVADAVGRLAGYRPRTGAESELALVTGGASDRWYYRVRGAAAARYDRESVVVMGVSTGLREILESFAGNQAFMLAAGLPVPRIHAESTHEGLLLIEDFGDLTMTSARRRYPDRRRLLYADAIALLHRMHNCGGSSETATCPAFSLDFDVEKYRYEYDFHVCRWLIGHHWQTTPTHAEQTALEAGFRWIGERLAAPDRVFTHRDYQTSNLMVLDDGSLGLLDFQDARMGLRQYDLASLLYDSYVDVGEPERADLAESYRLGGAGTPEADAEEYYALLGVAAIQRKLHDAGAFVYTAAHRGKSEFLKHVPAAVQTATTLMASVPECREAGAILSGYSQQHGSG